MNEQEALAYVKAAARAVSLPLDEARAARVAVHFGRTAVLAAQLEGFDMAVHHEAAEIYSPAPFPGTNLAAEES